MSWWKNVWRRRSQDAELDAELRCHVDRRIQDYVSAGVSTDEARRRVQMEFGGLDQTKEECRDVRPLHWLDDFVRDVRLGFRGLARDRLFAVSVTTILALGIGTSVTMFSVLDAVVLRPLPYARPGAAGADQHAPHHAEPMGWHVGGQLLRLAPAEPRLRGHDVLPANQRQHGHVCRHRRAARAQEGLVGPEFFELLGTPPLIGRTFSREEFDERERVVVLSEGLWQEQFATIRRRPRPDAVDRRRWTTW